MEPKECHDAQVVERMLNMRMDGIERRLTEQTGDINLLQRDVDSAVGDLWKNIRESMDGINRVIAAHADSDNKAMHNIETNLLTRVPAWALAVMSIGASIIGAMAMYILDHLK